MKHILVDLGTEVVDAHLVAKHSNGRSTVRINGRDIVVPTNQTRSNAVKPRAHPFIDPLTAMKCEAQTGHNHLH